MENSQVNICELVLSGNLSDIVREIDLGNSKLNLDYDTLLEKVRSGANKVYLLEWEGDKIPQGVMVDDQEIAWTQHGVVRSSEGDTIGTYQRLVEFGGESRNLQVMLVYSWKKDTTDQSR